MGDPVLLDKSAASATFVTLVASVADTTGLLIFPSMASENFSILM